MPGCRCRCVASVLNAPCQPGLAVDGGPGAGSLPPVTVDTVGVEPYFTHPCGPLQARYGPQVDVLISNPEVCSFQLEAGVSSAGAIYSLEPGASFALGWAIAAWPINTPPAAIPAAFPTSYYGGQNVTNFTGAVICGVTDNKSFLPQLTPFVLTSGDFIWFSIQTMLFITGAGASTTVAPISGAGPLGTIRGVRL